IIERKPLGNARGEFAVFFDLLEDFEIFPTLGIVLEGSEAPLGSIGESGLHRLAALVVGGLGNGIDDGGAGRLAQNAVGLPVRIAVDFSALGVAAGDGNAGELQSAGIGDGDVPIHAVQKNRMVAGNLVYIPARGDGLDGPEVFVPAAAQNPVPRGGRFDLSANAFAKLVERLHADEIDVQTLGPAFGKVDVRVIESRHDELSAQID